MNPAETRLLASVFAALVKHRDLFNTACGPLQQPPSDLAAAAVVLRRIAIHEIRLDVQQKKVSREVTTFSELHDFVDANEYGLLCDSLLEDLECEDDCDPSEEYSTASWELASAVQAQVHAWLMTGCLALE